MSAKEKENTERINVFLPSAILTQLKTEAKTKGTTVSGLMRMIVMEYFQNKK